MNENTQETQKPNDRQQPKSSAPTAGYTIPLWLRIRKLFGGVVVALQDYDGEVTYRPAKRNPYGLSCYRMALRTRHLQLNIDGTISPPCYVKQWKMV